MNEQTLFRQTRWRLASWYAGVMGIILALSGFGVYEAIDHAHRTAADRELQVISGRLHDDLEPMLQQPGTIPTRAQRFLPDPCSSPSQCKGSMRATGLNVRVPRSTVSLRLTSKRYGRCVMSRVAA